MPRELILVFSEMGVLEEVEVGVSFDHDGFGDEVAAVPFEGPLDCGDMREAAQGGTMCSIPVGWRINEKVAIYAPLDLELFMRVILPRTCDSFAFQIALGRRFDRP